MVTEQEGALLVRKFTDSKLSGRKFCRENGIKPQHSQMLDRTC